MKTKTKKFLQRYRVFAGFLFAVLFVVFARPTPTSLAIGTAIAAFGLALRAWACGHIRKVAALDTSGPYAYTRNPLYLGTFIMAVGFSIAAGVWWLAVLAALFYLSIYLPVMNVEAEELESYLKEEFREYAEAVPLFIPRTSPWKKQNRRFDFQIYLKHREYNAAIGFVVIVALLWVKIYLFDL
jgi:protein-S-isoprenylcysteine O-methyltransferase Ste14